VQTPWGFIAADKVVTEDIIANALITIAVTVLLGYLTSVALLSKPTIDARTGKRIFVYVRAFRALALISVAFPAFMGALSLRLYLVEQSDYVVWLALCPVFTVMSGYLVLETFVVRLTGSEGEITSMSPWTGKRTFQWEEIKSIHYSKISKWHILVGPDGKKIYASDYLSGSGYLRAEFRKRIPPAKWR
jgi:hypothetical protein